MWIKTLSGDLVNLDQIVRIGHYGGNGDAVLYAMGDNGLVNVAVIDEVTWKWVQHELPSPRKKS